MTTKQKQAQHTKGQWKVELLAAAKALFGSIDPSGIRTDTEEGLKWRALAAAIAKAEGEEGGQR